MKLSFLYLFLVLMIIAGCSTTKKAADQKGPYIVKAGYHRWSHVPAQNSTVPEKGIDLALIVKNLPEGAIPQAIIYNHYKSFKPIITDTTNVGVVMSARIVVASSLLQTTSKRTDLSDRLIYKKKNGSIDYIKINDWTEVEE